MHGADSTAPARRVGLTLTQQIILGLVIGIAAGALVSRTHPEWAQFFNPFSQLFLRLIKMIIAPLIFGTLVAGVAGAGHVKAVGRMGLRAMIYFEAVTTVALLIGLVVVNLLKPGVGLVLPSSGARRRFPRTRRRGIRSCCTRFRRPSSRRWPTAMSCRLSSGRSSSRSPSTMVGPKGRPVIEFCESLAETMFKFTNIVMSTRQSVSPRPWPTRSARAASACSTTWPGWSGPSTSRSRRSICSCCFRSWSSSGVPVGKFVRAVKEPAVIAFSTTSSEAALPRAMEAMERLGVPRSVVAFVLPLGYSFNLDGSTLYLSLAAVFVAQAANVHLSIGQQITLLLTLMLTSKGVAGVPRAALVILAATLASYRLPLEGVTLILGVDTLMDMGRTMTNVIGNCLASVVVARWEGRLQGSERSRSRRSRRSAAKSDA